MNRWRLISRVTLIVIKLDRVMARVTLTFMFIVTIGQSSSTHLVVRRGRLLTSC